MKAKITSKGQVTIPLAIRQRLRLKVGQVLEFDENTPFVKATKVINEKQMRSVIGSCKLHRNKTSNKILDELRGEVELP